MRALEERAFEGGVSADALMEEAGLGIARAVRQFFPWPGVCIAVFGKGNNGGDALVAARHLSEAGWDVRLLPVFPQADWGAQVRAKYQALGSPACADEKCLESAVGAAGGRALIVLDGILGTGSSGPLRGEIAGMTQGINALRARSHAHVFALDLPTGLDGDTGAVAEGCVTADTTLTIGFPKTGLVADVATAVVGRLAVVPLSGLQPDGDSAAEIVATPATLPMLPRRAFESHKGDYGRVGIIAGSPGMYGAAVLCATAAVRAGAGLVTLYAPVGTAAHLAAACPPEVMVQEVDSLRECLKKRHDVFAIGPGLGSFAPFPKDCLVQPSQTVIQIRQFVAECKQPVVVDADALNAIGSNLFLLEESDAERVLTPHPGEMERLVPGAGAMKRRAVAAQFAERFPHCTVLLKGARTVVAKAGEPLSYNSSGTPGMAVGGMGDTLTGVIAALIGQRMKPYDAARLGAWLCGRAGELAISLGGETEETLTPTRLVDFLAKAFRELRAGCF